MARYMARRRRPPRQGWKTFLRNHADGIPSMDLFVNPTISFRPLYGFLILWHSRREVLRLVVTAHLSAQWIGTEACGWDGRRDIYRSRSGAIYLRAVQTVGRMLPMPSWADSPAIYSSLSSRQEQRGKFAPSALQFCTGRDEAG
jgi:hypothetical protein